MRSLLHRHLLSRGPARHRAPAPGGSRTARVRARGTDIVLAVIGLAMLGGFCLLVAAEVIVPTLRS